MNLLGIVGGMIEPLFGLVDELFTSEEEKAQAKGKIFAVQAKLFQDTLVYEQEVLKSKADIIKAEANGQSWLQRNWRPITMLTFLVLVVCDSFGLLTFRLSGEAWTLLQIGLGGYVVGRSGEKIMGKVSEMKIAGNNSDMIKG